MSYIKLLILFLLILTLSILTGCAEKKVEYVTVTKVKYVKIPDKLINDNIKLPNPPDRSIYIDSNPYKREKMLIFYILDLQTTIAKYKNKLRVIKNYNKNIKTIKGR